MAFQKKITQPEAILIWQSERGVYRVFDYFYRPAVCRPQKHLFLNHGACIAIWTLNICSSWKNNILFLSNLECLLLFHSKYYMINCNCEYLKDAGTSAAGNIHDMFAV